MHRVVWRSGLGVFALGMLMAWPVFDNIFLSPKTEETLAANLIEAAQTAEASVGTPLQRRHAAAKAIQARVVQGLEAGATKDDVAAAIQEARNDPAVSPATAAALDEAQKGVADASPDSGAADDAPGAIATNPNPALLAAPAPAAAGAGYRPG